jgi:hypothetical protein
MITTLLTFECVVKHKHNHMQYFRALVYMTSVVKAKELSPGRGPIKQDAPWVITASTCQLECLRMLLGREKNNNYDLKKGIRVNR